MNQFNKNLSVTELEKAVKAGKILKSEPVTKQLPDGTKYVETTYSVPENS